METPTTPVLKTEPVEPIERPQSPELNCSICLERFRNRSYTNSCMHQFCYLCLKEWSKIKAECPLCKTNFSTIIHNVRALNDYDEYRVEPQEGIGINRASSFFINVEIQRRNNNHRAFNSTSSPPTRRLLDEEGYRRAVNILGPGHMLFFQRSNFLYPPYNPAEGREPTGGNLLHEFEASRNRNNRREIYRQGRWVRPSGAPRFRECNPEFYRANPSQTHRLVPWLTRDLNLLLNLDVNVRTVVHDILRLITQYHVHSCEFRTYLRPLLGQRVNHFIHEFYNFAISVHDMMAYDVLASYEPPGATPSLLDLAEASYSSDSDSDLEVVHVLPKKEKYRDRGETSGLDLTNRPGPSTAPIQPVTIEIDSDSSSDVEIIHVPPKTPEIITIDDSDNDSEVCMINGENETMILESNKIYQVTSSSPNSAVLHTNIDAILEYENPERASPVDMNYLMKKEGRAASPSSSSRSSSTTSRSSSPRQRSRHSSSPNGHILAKKEKNQPGPSSEVQEIDSDSSGEVEIIPVRPKTPVIIDIASDTDSDATLNGIEELSRRDGVYGFMVHEVPDFLGFTTPVSPVHVEERPASPCASSRSNSRSVSPRRRSSYSSSCSSSLSQESNSSSSSSSESSILSNYNKKTMYSKKRRKPVPINSACNRSKKKLKTSIKNEDVTSCSDEEYVPWSKPRLKSVVVKANANRPKRPVRANPYYFLSDSD